MFYFVVEFDWYVCADGVARHTRARVASEAVVALVRVHACGDLRCCVLWVLMLVGVAWVCDLECTDSSGLAVVSRLCGASCEFELAPPFVLAPPPLLIPLG